MVNRSEPTYLGDGLYATYNGWDLELFAHNGIAKTNSVYLDPEVLAKLLDYVKGIKGAGEL